MSVVITYMVSNIMDAVAVSLLLPHQNTDSLRGYPGDAVGWHQHHRGGGDHAPTQQLQTGRNHNNFHKPGEGLGKEGKK